MAVDSLGRQTLDHGLVTAGVRMRVGNVVVWQHDGLLRQVWLA